MNEVEDLLIGPRGPVVLVSWNILKWHHGSLEVGNEVVRQELIVRIQDLVPHGDFFPI